MTEEVKTDIPVSGVDDKEAAVADATTDILKLKKELAGKYIDELKTQKEGGLTGMIIGKGNTLKDYLVSEGIGDKIMDNIKGGFMEKFFTSVDTQSFVIGGVTYASIFDYLKPIKEKIDNANTKQALDDLAAAILTTSAVVPPVISANNQVPSGENNVEYNDTTNREKVLTSLNKVVEKDKTSPIRYTWGGKTDPEKGLDCSGLLYYTIDQAGLTMPGDSRSMFQTFNPKKLELKEGTHQVTTDVSDIKEGDVIRWNSTNPDYHRSTGAIPKIEKNNKEYRIHHVAFIKKIDTDTGIVTVVESNGAEGIVESKVDIAKQLTGTNHKSELYVAHVNYDNLPTKAPTITAIAA
ncbi:MAG: NlpC/P60 family protein [Candidatus Absconditabacterales bacterium]